MIEFVNSTGHVIVLTGPNHEKIQLNKFERKFLPEWYKRYVPRYLRVLGTSSVSPIAPIKSPTRPPETARPQIPPTAPKAFRPVATLSEQQRVLQEAQRRNQQHKLSYSEAIRAKARAQVEQYRVNRGGRTIGRLALSDTAATNYYREVIQRLTVPISNDIGVGILSYNRLNCLCRLLDSIRNYTDLTQTTVFVSDESSDQKVKAYLQNQKDIVVLDNIERLGVAGNTNRLLRCLERFRYKILLNDDVEILGKGWEQFYANAMAKSGIHHFCMRQPGVYGAGNEGHISESNGLKIQTIMEKPHGAVMAFDVAAFKAAGFFDERFGWYGMEHVDWSNRVSLSGIQPAGFHDIIGSETLFRIHTDKSATENRAQHLSEAKKLYDSVRHDKKRIYISPTNKSIVPGMSCIVPFRDQNRRDAIGVVLQNLKAQRFPYLEIWMVEQDSVNRVNIPAFESINYLLAKADQQFNKSLAFNLGASKASFNKLLLHDADMLAHGQYAQQVAQLLDNYNGIHIGRNVLYLNGDSTAKVIAEHRLTADLALEKTVAYFEGGSLACRKDVYVKIGGFNESFIGFGCEDCEFFERLAAYERFCNDRTIDLFHLQHGRTPGWKECHQRNKALAASLRRQPMPDRMAVLNKTYLKKYQ